MRPIRRPSRHSPTRAKRRNAAPLRRFRQCPAQAVRGSENDHHITSSPRHNPASNRSTGPGRRYPGGKGMPDANGRPGELRTRDLHCRPGLPCAPASARHTARPPSPPLLKPQGCSRFDAPNRGVYARAVCVSPVVSSIRAVHASSAPRSCKHGLRWAVRIERVV